MFEDIRTFLAKVKQIFADVAVVVDNIGVTVVSLSYNPILLVLLVLL